MISSTCLFCHHPLIFANGNKSLFPGTPEEHGDRVMDVVGYSSVSTCKSCGAMYKIEMTELKEPSERRPNFMVSPQIREQHVKQRDELLKRRIEK